MIGETGHLPFPSLDLTVVLRFVVSLVIIASGLRVILWNTVSKFFFVDSNFEAGAIRFGEDSSEVGSCLAVGSDSGGGDSEDEECFVRGNRGNKLDRSSHDCKSQHWKDDDKLKCREKEDNSTVLIPAHGVSKVLSQPKKILFPYDDFMKLYYWNKQVFPPCGLLNCGNSCFANVVLQCLSYTRPLVGYLLEGSHSRKCKQSKWCFLCEIQSHIQKVIQSSQPFSPIKILSRLPNIGSHLDYGNQEDAHEFMRFAIDTMQSVYLDEFGGERSLNSSTQETSVIQHIFGGHLKSQVKCTECNMVSNRFENMMDLTVEIQGEAESLEDCLDQFTAKEWLEGENKYKCDGCNGYVKAWKSLAVHQPPNILTVALKRFQCGRFGKLNKRIAFPVTLDLGPYISSEGDKDNLYSLYAVVVHLDTLNASYFGHYICYTKDFCGNWYRIDDCKVMRVQVEEVLSQGAYMLLYSRLHVRQPMSSEITKGNELQPSEFVLGNSGVSESLNSYAVTRSNLPMDVDTFIKNGTEADVGIKEPQISTFHNSNQELQEIMEDVYIGGSPQSAGNSVECHKIERTTDVVSCASNISCCSSLVQDKLENTAYSYPLFVLN